MFVCFVLCFKIGYGNKTLMGNQYLVIQERQALGARQGKEALRRIFLFFKMCSSFVKRKVMKNEAKVESRLIKMYA